MALKSTIFKADIQIADMDRNYYQTHALTIARHPSETDERMMVRILAFALHAGELLAFANGLSTDDEPDLWQKDLTGAIEVWIDVGQPDEKLVRKACGRADEVFIYTYSGHGASIWWDQNKSQLERNGNLTISSLTTPTSKALAKLAQRNMALQCTIQDGQIWITDTRETVHVELLKLQLPTQGYRS